MTGKTNVGGGGQQPKLASISAVTDVPASLEYDWQIKVLNGVYGDYPAELEIYRDGALLTPLSAYNVTITDDTWDYKRPLYTHIDLRDKGLGIRGSHVYKFRMVCEGFEPSDYTADITHTMYARIPDTSISGDTISIESDDAFTDQYNIYADGTLKTTINKTGSSQTFDLRSLNLANGSHIIVVRGVGVGIAEGYGQDRTYVVSLGYNITVNLVADSDYPQMMDAYIKLNSAPSSSDDYNYYYSGGIGTYDSDLPASFLASKVYVWGSDGQITAPVTEDLYPSHTTYNTAKEITYSADGTLGLHFYYDE